MGGVRTVFHYADEGLVGEYDASGAVLKTYGYQPGGTWTTDPLFMKVGDSYYFYHDDHLGTPVAMTDVNGAVVWAAQYDSFGKAVVDMTATVTNNLRFPGQYYDEETGLHYNWNRYYDPSTGRYITTDPIGFEGEDVNLYRYAQSNPINFADPLGLLFGINAGESYGEYAAQYWADRQVETGNPLYYVPGLLASLWTPETSNKTALTLAGGYMARVLGPFSPRGLPKYLQRLRKYIRLDPPHHGKGWHIDGDWFKSLLPLLGLPDEPLGLSNGPCER